MLCRQSDSFGDRLRVTLLDRSNLIYMYKVRSGVPLNSTSCESCYTIAVWNSQQRQQGMEVIRSEAAPRDGRRRCQDGVLEAVTAPEAEEIVSPGT